MRTVNPTLVTAPSAAIVHALDGVMFEPARVRLQYGENLYRSYPRIADDNVPHIAVFVLTRTGEPPAPMRSPQLSFLSSLVSVYLRGEPGRFEESEDLARLVWWYLHTMEMPPQYVDCRCQEAEPEWNGTDAAGHPQWTINLRMKREE